MKEDALYVSLHSRCANSAGIGGYRWEKVKREYGEAVEALEAEFEKCSECPREEQLGEIWFPFREHMNLHEMWDDYYGYQQERTLRFPLEKSGYSSAYFLNFDHRFENLLYVYQGVVAGRILKSFFMEYTRAGIFFLENEWRPETAINRSDITGVPLTVLVLIEGILRKYGIRPLCFSLPDTLHDKNYSLKEWRKIRTSGINKWMNINQKLFFTERIETLGKSRIVGRNSASILYKYWVAYFQDYYHMTIDYEEGASISFCKKSETETESELDLFPPMLFCKAANERSRQYICDENVNCRKGITMDHPFIKWLLENAILLNQYYQRQFQQIVDCLCNKSGKDILNECNNIRQQLIKLPEHHGVDVDNFPVLSVDDFWDKGKPMDN